MSQNGLTHFENFAANTFLKCFLIIKKCLTILEHYALKG